MGNKYDPVPPGKRRVFTRTIRLKSGDVLYAHNYGLKCFSFLVPIERQKKDEDDG